MADTDELFRRLTADKRSPVVLSGLVLNEKGLDRGLACGVGLFCLGASASDTHSRKNSGMGSDEATRRIIAAAGQARAAGKRVQLSVQSAFGCGFEGRIPEERVLAMVRAYLDAGFRQISLADTAGHAHPGQVAQLFGAVAALDPAVELTCHFHNTYGLGMANIFAALDAGVTSFETSFAGLGGCPFTKVAAGNVATEDLVHALQLRGQRRDVDLDCLIGVARDVAAHFGREMPGCVYKTGPIPVKEPA
jgi:hydroxymethylglutaryl-CoA lyase